MKIAIASDHAGTILKAKVCDLLNELDIDYNDYGPFSEDSVDYPDYAKLVANNVSKKQVDKGILICGTGIGMSIAANKYKNVRCALVNDLTSAKATREHNDSNCLALGARVIEEQLALDIVRVWVTTEYSEDERHSRRINKITEITKNKMNLKESDQEIYDAILGEQKRQRQHIELIASENFVSKEVLAVQGSVLTNKYAEGYPNKRYYGGCEYVDVVEQLACDRLKEIYGAEHANVQPHSGSQANMAVYMTVLKPGDSVLGMSLTHGGHLTHGHNLNFSGINYNFHFYGVEKETEVIDYNKVLEKAKEVKPKLIVAGASAYSRIIDFKEMRRIADEVGAYLMVDMAHIAGPVAAGLHPNPVGYAHFVTTTTHKTLRGPRGGAILCQNEFAKEIDRAVFPGMQGGPLMHVIAAKAVAFKEALAPEFKIYQQNVINNARTFASSLQKEGFRVISGGTDNHQLSIDVKSTIGLTGKEAESILESINITCNKNTIPFDTEKPFITSGLRIGTPAMTTRGFTESEFEVVAKIIAKALKNHNNKEVINECKNQVISLTMNFPLYE